MRVALIFSLLMFGTAAAVPSDRESCGVEVLVSGVPVPSYYHNGRTYIEALRGREYSILLTNPLGSRVAVALSVDGLNTINARRTEARFGHKWILGPHESVVISGWQTGAQHARRFFFTTEERSYGAWLGQTENLGVISAAFFKERIRVVQRPVPMQPLERTWAGQAKQPRRRPPMANMRPPGSATGFATMWSGSNWTSKIIPLQPSICVTNSSLLS
jgi:hypothetical protein